MAVLNAEGTKLKKPHHVIMEEREKITVTGVCDVDHFNENTIALFTQQGGLKIKGSGLHINRIELEMGEIEAQGNIDELIYSEDSGKTQGFFAKVFK